MSQEKIKEAIGLLEEAVGHIKDTNVGYCIVNADPEMLKNWIEKVVILLRPLAEPCKTCEGFGKVNRHNYSKRRMEAIPCPDCQAEEPEMGEFTKELRKICAEERNELRPFVALEIVEEACDTIDRQAAEIEELKDK